MSASARDGPEGRIFKPVRRVSTEYWYLVVWPDICTLLSSVLRQPPMCIMWYSALIFFFFFDLF